MKQDKTYFLEIDIIKKKRERKKAFLFIDEKAIIVKRMYRSNHGSCINPKKKPKTFLQ